jgi:hypothetical protein
MKKNFKSKIRTSTHLEQIKVGKGGLSLWLDQKSSTTNRGATSLVIEVPYQTPRTFRLWIKVRWQGTIFSKWSKKFLRKFKKIYTSSLNVARLPNQVGKYLFNPTEARLSFFQASQAM